MIGTVLRYIKTHRYTLLSVTLLSTLLCIRLCPAAWVSVVLVQVYVLLIRR